jgi:hypothetical protein
MQQAPKRFINSGGNTSSSTSSSSPTKSAVVADNTENSRNKFPISGRFPIGKTGKMEKKAQ